MSQLRSKILRIGTVATILILIATGFFAALSFRPESTAKMFKTPAWQEQGLLMIRRANSNGGDLLLKHSKATAIYQYNPDTGDFKLSSDEKWNLATGNIVDCEHQFSPAPQILRIDPKTNKLFAGSREISTAGKTVLDLRASPSNRSVAVLSAAGTKSSILPFLGSTVSGQRYNEILSLPDASPIGKPERLQLNHKGDVLTACWSSDEEYLVYTDALFFSVSILKTNLSTRPKSSEVTHE